MNETIAFLVKHGYAVLFAVVLLEQIGLPLPSAPFLLAAGALAGLGKMNLLHALTLAVVASLIGDSLWFYLGKRRGSSILQFLCKIALEPDSCVRQTGSVYTRYGASSLLFAKFVPGLNTVAPPIAGMFKLAPWKFVLLDGAGAALWAGSFAVVGWWFREQLEVLAVYLERFGSGFGILVALALASYIAVKYIQRQRLYRSLRIARITPHELKERMESGETLTIIDLRNAIERQEGRIPGSIQLSIGELDSATSTFTLDEIVLLHLPERSDQCPRRVIAQATGHRARSSARGRLPFVARTRLSRRRCDARDPRTSRQDGCLKCRNHKNAGETKRFAGFPHFVKSP